MVDHHRRQEPGHRVLQTDLELLAQPGLSQDQFTQGRNLSAVSLGFVVLLIFLILYWSY